jgi:hypothetical protein
MKILRQFAVAVFLLTISCMTQAMNLKLQFPPTPEFAKSHAEIAVSSVQRVEEITLDYSPESLAIIDKIIQQFRKDGLTPDEIAETIFTFGCYAGEVFVRNKKAVWAVPADVMPPDVAQHFPFMVVKLPDGQVWSPINKAFSQLENGSEDSLLYMYQVSGAKP